MEEDMEGMELCRVKGQKSSVVHSVKQNTTNGRYIWFSTICNRELYGHAFCDSDIYKITEESVTCKACAKKLGIPIDHEPKVEDKMRDNKKVVKFVRNEKTGVAHYVEKVKRHEHYAVPTYDAMCGASLSGEKYKKVAGMVPFRLCKTCKAVYDRDYGGKRIIDEKPQSEQHAGNQHYIAEEVESGEMYVASSLKGLLKKLKDKLEDGDLLVALEEGEFTFYKGIEIDIQTKVEITKEVTELSEC